VKILGSRGQAWFYALPLHHRLQSEVTQEIRERIFEMISHHGYHYKTETVNGALFGTMIKRTTDVLFIVLYGKHQVCLK
jgi:hypothetical protein